MKDQFSMPDAALEERAEMPEETTTAAVPSSHKELMAMDGVEGVGTGESETGEPVHVVYVRDEESGRQVPKTMNGRKVRVEVTGPVRALGV